jgi:hypothetical protein
VIPAPTQHVSLSAPSSPSAAAALAALSSNRQLRASDYASVAVAAAEAAEAAARAETGLDESAMSAIAAAAENQGGSGGGASGGSAGTGTLAVRPRLAVHRGSAHVMGANPAVGLAAPSAIQHRHSVGGAAVAAPFGVDRTGSSVSVLGVSHASENQSKPGRAVRKFMSRVFGLRSPTKVRAEKAAAAANAALEAAALAREAATHAILSTTNHGHHVVSTADGGDGAMEFEGGGGARDRDGDTMGSFVDLPSQHLALSPPPPRVLVAPGMSRVG